VVNTILSEMDGLEELQSVVVIGATNRPNLIDPALLRPGRFDELVYVGVPDNAGRERILRIQTAKMPLASDVDLSAIAERTERYTGADLEDVVRRAGLVALRSTPDAREVNAAHFEAALKDSRATVTPEMEEEYQAMSGRLKQQASAIQPIGFIAPGMLRGHGPKGED
jgi:transitional endoplasmic reticulum ATPase